LNCRGYLTASDIADARGWSRQYVWKLWRDGKLRRAKRVGARGPRSPVRFKKTRALLEFCKTGHWPPEPMMPFEVRYVLAGTAQDVADFRRDVEAAKTPMEEFMRVDAKLYEVPEAIQESSPERCKAGDVSYTPDIVGQIDERATNFEALRQLVRDVLARPKTRWKKTRRRLRGKGNNFS
jgi:hypothetical protein